MTEGNELNLCIDGDGAMQRLREPLEVHPCGEMVLIERIVRKDLGLILPDNIAKNSDLVEAIVLEVGPGPYSTAGTRMPPDIHVGQKVVVPADAAYFQTKDQEGRIIQLVPADSIHGWYEGDLV